MASINNWLAFSLSRREVASQSPSQASHQMMENAVDSGSRVDLSFGYDNDLSGDCFELVSESGDPSLNLPNLRLDGSFDIMEDIDGTNETQDWNIKSLTMNTDTSFKSSPSLSTIMDSNSGKNIDPNQPKLEDFLGSHSFTGHETTKLNRCPCVTPPGFDASDDYPFNNCSLQLPRTQITNQNAMNHGEGSSASSIGLSMIKSWLRNQTTKNLSNNMQDGMSGSNRSVSANRRTVKHSQTLSLSTGAESQTTSREPLLPGHAGNVPEPSLSLDRKMKGTALDSQTAAIETIQRKSLDNFGQRTSIYRGVTKHRWTGRFEAHLWDNSCRREGQTRKGRQVYLGGYDKEEKAARAYDLAALKYWGPTSATNFPVSSYEKELEEMKYMTRQEYVASLRRKSSGFSRGASMYRGVTRHHQHGRWQARIGRVAGNKDLYLGTFSTQEEAAEAYDIAAIKFRGLNAVTNFDMSRYDIKSILESGALPIGSATKRSRDVEHNESGVEGIRNDNNSASSQFNHIGYGGSHRHEWTGIAVQQQPQPLSVQYPCHQSRIWCKSEQEHELVGNALNTFHQSGIRNLTNLDSIVLGHNISCSNPVTHTGASGNNGYIMHLGSMNNQNQGNYEGNEVIVNTMYSIHQESPAILKPSNGYGQSSYTTWMQNQVQTIMPRTNDVGSQVFTVWNDE